MNNGNSIVCALLECRYLDAEFIDKELDAYGIDAYDAISFIKDSFGKSDIDANAVIYAIYSLAIDKAIDDSGADQDLIGCGDSISIFTNCIDSHLNIKDKNGDWHEMDSYETLIDFLSANYTNHQDDAHNNH